MRRKSMIVSAVLGAIAVLLLPAAGRAGEKVFVCNPFPKAQTGLVMPADATGKALKVAVPPLACVEADLGAAEAPGAAKPLEGLYVARPISGKPFEIIRAGKDKAYVVDCNGNGKPDFAGDRWVFDGGGDGQVESVAQFVDANKDGKAEEVRFFLTHYWARTDWIGHTGSDMKRELRKRRDPFPLADGLTATADLGKPCDTWFDKTGDGTWCLDSILTGGAVHGDWLFHHFVEAEGGEHQRSQKLMQDIRHYDLDGDGDLDIMAFSDGTVFRSTIFDSSDLMPNPTYTYDLFAGNGKFLWTEMENGSWRSGAKYGTFGFWGGYNYLLADLKKKYNLWMGTQDEPHGVYDLDGDDIPDAFIASSASGGPSDVYEREGKPPAVWQTLERFFVGLGAPGQFNFNLDFNPYKRERPDRNVSLPIKTFMDRWGNKLENYVGTFSPPDGWDGKKLSAFNADGTPAEWMAWLWDWHLGKPYKDLYVGVWVRDRRSCGEGAAVCAGEMNDLRAEGDFDCSTDFNVYYSPLINAFHLQGADWGWWIIRSMPPKSIQERFGDIMNSMGIFPHNQFRYGMEVLDTDIRRFHSESWGCYFDRDRDGIVDTYLLDTNNDGSFETRLWYDHAKGNVLWADGNRFQRASLKVEFPMEKYCLKNYKHLRAFYQEKLKGAPILGTDGKVQAAGGTETQPEGTVAFDAVHAGGKPGYAELGREGFSRLATAFARRPAAIQALASPFNAESMKGITHLVITAIKPESQLSEAELQALDEWLRAGGRLLAIYPGQEAPADGHPGIKYGIKSEDRTVECNQDVVMWNQTIAAEVVVKEGKGGALFQGADGKPLAYRINLDGPYVNACRPLSVPEGGKALLTLVDGNGQKSVLAASVAVGKGQIIVCAAPSLLSNQYTAYKPTKPKPSVFDARRLGNRVWMEEVIEGILPCGDAIAKTWK